MSSHCRHKHNLSLLIMLLNTCKRSMVLWPMLVSGWWLKKWRSAAPCGSTWLVKDYSEFLYIVWDHNCIYSYYAPCVYAVLAMLLVVWHQKSYPSCEKSRFSTPKGLPGEFIEPRLTGGNNRNMMVKQIKTDNSRCLYLSFFCCRAWQKWTPKQLLWKKSMKQWVVTDLLFRSSSLSFSHWQWPALKIF